MVINMKKPVIHYAFVLLCLIVSATNAVNGQDGYPVPEKSAKMLFYFQRSHNKNTVVYEINALPNGKVNPEKPVNFYWIRFEEGGVRKELSFIQRKAFGIQWQSVNKSKESFVLQFNQFRKRNIFLVKTEISNGYKAYISINGELCELTRMFIKSENNSLGIPLSVKYIEIAGASIKSGKNIVERYIP
jgi:hypothetical protein